MKQPEYLEFRVKKITVIAALVLIASAAVWSWRGDISNIIDAAIETDKALDKEDQERAIAK